MPLPLIASIMSTSVVTVADNAALTDVLATMEQQQISCVIAVDQSFKPVGIFTEQDAVSVLAAAQPIKQMTVNQVMSTQLCTATSDLDTHSAYQLISENNCRHLIIIDKAGKLTGVVSEADFLHHLGLGYLVEYKTVATVMSRQIITLGEQDSLARAVQLMAINKISCVLITRNDKPSGILTERDLVHLAQKELDPETTLLQQVMHQPVHCIDANEPLQQAILKMQQLGIRRLAVVDGDSLAGLLTRHDIVKLIKGGYIEFLEELLSYQRQNLAAALQQIKIDQQQRLLNTLMQQVNDAIFLINPADGAILEGNKRACDSLGYTHEELLQQNMREFCTAINDPSDWEKFCTTLEQQGQLVYQSQHKRRDNSEFPVEVNTCLITENEQRYFIAVARDLSAIRQHQEQLQHNEALLKEAQQIARIGNWEMDLFSNELHCSDEVFRIFERDPNLHATSYDALLEYVHPEDRKRVEQFFSDSIQKHQAHQIEYRLLLADGRIKWLHERGLTQYDAGGKPIRAVGTIQDISEHKYAEQQRDRDKQQISRQNDTNQALNEILRISVLDIPLQQQLSDILHILLELPWVSLEQKGCIFLKEPHKNQLKLAVSFNLAEDLLNLCSQVSFGHCLCGRVAQSKQPLYKTCIDDDHVTRYQGMKAHGHTIAPIIHRNELLGVLNLYVRHDQNEDPADSDFILSAANILGSVIYRQQAKEQLHIVNQSLIRKNTILDLIAQRHPLADILDRLAKLIEQRFPGVICAILLLDDDGVHLRHAAAPSLPEYYNCAVDRLAIGANVGSCGAAAFNKQRTIVDDIENHPNWNKFRTLTQKANLKSCWSQPIFDHQQRVLGTFGLYRREKYSPDTDEINLIEELTQFAALAIEQDSTEKSLATSKNILEVISQGQMRFISDTDLGSVMESMLTAVLEITHSEFGFIGEVVNQANNQRVIRVHAINENANNKELHTFFIDNRPEILEFQNLDNLISAILLSGQAVIANDPEHDPRACGLPPNHPRLTAFMGLPFFHGQQMKGLIGLANRPGGYSENLQLLLEPLLSTCGNLISGFQLDQQRKQALKALQSSEQKYQDLYDNAPSMFASVDHQSGKVIECNQILLDATGYDKAEIIGSHILQFYHPDCLTKAKKAFNDFKNNGQVHNAELSLKTKNGDKIPVLLSVSAVRDSNGRILYSHSVWQDITRFKQEQTAHRRLRQIYQELVNSIDGIVWEAETESCRFTFVSHQAERILGFPVTQWLTKKHFWQDLMHPDDREWVLQNCRDAIVDRKDHQLEYRVRKADGDYIWIKYIVSVIVEQNKPSKLRGLILDISESKLAEQEQRIAATTFESQEGMMITDAHQLILRVNRAFTELTGFSGADVLGRTPALLKSDRHTVEFYQLIEDILEQERYWQGEIWIRRKNGEIFPVWLTITAVTAANNQVTHYVSVFSDITQHKQDEEKIHHLAFYDPLTHLPNRSLLQDRLQQAISSSARNHRYGAVLFIDLDNFKILNDTMGHAVGDMLLIEVALRLQTCIRSEDTISRLGGDEFVVLLENLSSDENQASSQSEVIAKKIVTEINRPYLLNNREHHSSSSIGISLFVGNELTADELLQRADVAMYQAKHAGRNTLCFFDPSMQQALEVRSQLELDLRHALSLDQFELYFQIQVNIDNEIIGAEALLRWLHPQRGIVYPAEFIALAEETGLIVPIDRWLLNTACGLLKSWEKTPGLERLPLAINISIRQFLEADFINHLQATFAATGANPKRLKLELTETPILDNIANTIATMHKLKALGISFAMDDFGTGYSSLSNLRQLPLDQLKIDQSFVSDITADPNDAAIVKTIIAMADSMGLDIIAEGVETKAQHDFLKAHGCRFFQGYLFSRPVPLQEFERLVRLEITSENQPMH